MGEESFYATCKKRINVIDFWVYNGIGAEIEGKNPIVSPNGQPNIATFAEYENKEERDKFFESIENDPEWKNVWVKHPNPDTFFHKNARFFKSIKS